MTFLTDAISSEHAEKVARQTVCVYEILDDVAAHAEDSDELKTEAIVCLNIALAIALTDHQVPESFALDQFRIMYRNVMRARKLLGAKATARDIMAEIHLEPGDA